MTGSITALLRLVNVRQHARHIRSLLHEDRDAVYTQLLRSRMASKQCSDCGGTGREDDWFSTGWHPCPFCKGTGQETARALAENATLLERRRTGNDDD